MTNKDLILTANLIVGNMGDQTTKTQKKLKKIYEKLKPMIDDYQEKLEDIRLDNASVDENGNLILDNKGTYKFTKEGIKKINEKIKELNDSVVEFKPIDIINPEGLDLHTYLKGWVNGINFKDEEVIDL